LGGEYSRNYGKVELGFNDNQVNILSFEKSICIKHDCNLLKDVEPPGRIVEDMAVFQVNRKQF
jgi:hypothetical protein